MRPTAASFRDRRDAGRRLAAELAPLRDESPVVLALPRGGVVVAVDVARALGAPLDILVVRKLGAPYHPEFGIGAVAQGNVVVVDQRSVDALRVTPQEFDEILARERLEMERRLDRYRGDRPLPEVQGRTVVLVDDGIATGGTARAAIRAVRAMGARRVILAAPVGAPDSVAELAREADEVVCPVQPEDFRAVGLWYDRFDQTEDEEVVALLQESWRAPGPVRKDVEIPVAAGLLHGTLEIPAGAFGVVVFAHGSGSGRLSPRNNAVARSFRDRGLGTLLFDLLTEEEEVIDARTRHLRFDIDLLGERLAHVTDWVADTRLPIGLFGSSTGAAAALVAAAARPKLAAAVVSRGGRPDLAGDALPRVRAPALLLVGALDREVLELNRDAFARLGCEKRLDVVAGASHLFEEPGKLEEVAALAADWFVDHLRAAREARGAARPGPARGGV